MYSIQGQGCESGKKSKPKRAELIASYVDVSGEKFSVIGTGLLLFDRRFDHFFLIFKILIFFYLFEVSKAKPEKAHRYF